MILSFAARIATTSTQMPITPTPMGRGRVPQLHRVALVDDGYWIAPEPTSGMSSFQLQGSSTALIAAEWHSIGFYWNPIHRLSLFGGIAVAGFIAGLSYLQEVRASCAAFGLSFCHDRITGSGLCANCVDSSSPQHCLLRQVQGHVNRPLAPSYLGTISELVTLATSWPSSFHHADRCS